MLALNIIYYTLDSLCVYEVVYACKYRYIYFQCLRVSIPSGADCRVIALDSQ